MAVVVVPPIRKDNDNYGFLGSNPSGARENSSQGEHNKDRVPSPIISSGLSFQP
jgi:hypothetical protein